MPGRAVGTVPLVLFLSDGFKSPWEEPEPPERAWPLSKVCGLISEGAGPSVHRERPRAGGVCWAAAAAAGLNISESARIWSLLGLGDVATEMSQSFCLKEFPC